jgi:hypothetical protein
MGAFAIASVLVALTAVEASAASAATFYVSTAGKDTNACTEPTSPCRTIAKAIADSEATEGDATIQIAAGVYEETLNLERVGDEGLTLDGTGAATVIQSPGAASEATLHLALPGGAITLSNLSIVNVSTDTHAGIESGAQTTLDDVTVDMRGEGDGIIQDEIGSLTMNGGGVTMENGAKGVAIGSTLDPVTVQSATVTIANGSESSGIYTEYAPLSVTATNLILGDEAKAAIESMAGSATLAGDSVTDASEKEPGLALALSEPLSIDGVQLTMTNAKDTSPGVIDEYGTSASIEGLDVGGTWAGPPLESVLGDITLRDSRLIAASAGTAPAAVLEGGVEGPGLFAQRSVLETSPTATAAVEAIDTNVTLDSSEVLGGKAGVFFEQGGGKKRLLTIAASTIDAGDLGVADPAGVSGVELVAAEDNSVAEATIVGSIVLEPQTAKIEAGGKAATITCGYSDTPSQTRAATSTEGSIACAAGAEGNTSSEVKSLFSEPLTSYQLAPSSSVLDSVPVSAVKLPSGFSLSSTDLAGNPRSEDVACSAVQDKGALELQGHGTACPTATPTPPPAPAATPKPLAGVLSALTISPSAFFAAPSGATISTSASGAKKYGAKISYRDSQVATTTFTVLLETSGRRQGRSCKKPSSKNKHGKRCTLLTKVGSFTHTDTAGANSLHFSGRIKGKKLPAGTYELEAVAHDAAGNGATVSKSFKIET